jgi:hypothetical protein
MLCVTSAALRAPAAPRAAREREREPRARLRPMPQPPLLRPRRFSPRAAALRARIETTLLGALPRRLLNTTVPERMLGAAAGGAALLLLLRWQAVLRAATPPALALVAASWVLAHERCAPRLRRRARRSRQRFVACATRIVRADAPRARSRAALEDDLVLLLRPARPRRRAGDEASAGEAFDEYDGDDDGGARGDGSGAEQEATATAWGVDAGLQVGGTHASRDDGSEAAVPVSHPNRGAAPHRR